MMGHVIISETDQGGLTILFSRFGPLSAALLLGREYSHDHCPRAEEHARMRV